MKMIKYLIAVLALMAITTSSVFALETKKFSLTLPIGNNNENIQEIKMSIIKSSGIIDQELIKKIDIENSSVTFDKIAFNQVGSQDVVATINIVYKQTTFLPVTSLTANLDLTLVDEQAPEITFNVDEDEELSLEYGSDFDPSMYIESITDNNTPSDDITVGVESVVDPSKPGVYDVIYHATDLNGNEAIKNLTVNIKDKKIRYIYYSGAEEATKAFYAAGASKVSGEEIHLNVPNYYQTNDNTELKTPYGGCGATIDRYGCALVSFSMVAGYYNVDINSHTVNDLGVNEASCAFKFSSAASAYDFDYTRLNTPASSLETKTVILGMLRQGYPAIVEFKKNNGGTHWVTVVGYSNVDGNQTFYVNNPETSLYTTLDGGLASGYIRKIDWVR